MPYAPQTAFRGDIHLAKGLDDVASAIADYTKSRDQAQMMHGYVQQAAQSGLMDPTALVDFEKGNLSKKLQLGADAQVAMKHFFEQQQLGQGAARIGLQGQAVGVDASRVAEGARQFDAEQAQRREEFKARGQVSVDRRDDIVPGLVTVTNQGTGTTQLLRPSAQEMDAPGEFIIREDPQTKTRAMWTGKTWKVLEPSMFDQLVGAGLIKGVAPQGATNPQPNPPGYKSAAEVKAAVAGGKLSREEGMAILRKDFGFK